MTYKRCFPPVVNGNTRVLILGSLPGEVSLAQAQYYAHPRNLFWKLVGDAISAPLAELNYTERLRVLLDHRIGLWDVIAEARRVGSLDSHIRDHASNDLIGLLDTLPNLAVVAFNGAKAETIGMKALGEHSEQYRLLRMPSSSPAHAAVTYPQKLSIWRQLAYV